MGPRVLQTFGKLFDQKVLGNLLNMVLALKTDILTMFESHPKNQTFKRENHTISDFVFAFLGVVAELEQKSNNCKIGCHVSKHDVLCLLQKGIMIKLILLACPFYVQYDLVQTLVHSPNDFCSSKKTSSRTACFKNTNPCLFFLVA